MRGLGVMVVLMSWSPSALATPDYVYVSTYHAVGFSKNGRYVYFEKRTFPTRAIDADMRCDHTILAVYDVRKRRRLGAVPVYRGGKGCSRSALVSKGRGKVKRRRLYKRYGAPVGGTHMAARKGVFRAGALRVWAEHTESAPAHYGLTAYVFDIWAQRGRAKKKRIAKPSIEEDDTPSLSNIVLSPDKKTVAFGLGNKPFIETL